MELKVFHHSFFEEKVASEMIAEEITEFLKKTELKTLGALVFFDADEVSESDTKNIQEALGDKVPLIGCSSDGEFSSTVGGVTEDSLVVGLLLTHGGESAKSYRVDLNENKTADEILRALKMQSRKEYGKGEGCGSSSPSLVFCFSESLNGTSGDNVINGVRDYFGSEPIILGGMSADQWNFVKTLQCFGDTLFSNSLVVLALHGTFNMRTFISSGFYPSGWGDWVRESTGPVVKRIGLNTAVDFYKKHLGTIEGSFGQYPIMVRPDSSSEEYFLRAPLRWDETTGEVEFAGNVPVGARVEIALTSRTDLLNATDQALSSGVFQAENSQQDTDNTKAVFAVYCAGRKMRLGSLADQEIKIIENKIPQGAPYLGFFSFGEYVSHPCGNRSSGFLNESAVILRL